MRVRRSYYLKPQTARLLDTLSITSGEEKSEIVDRGIVYAYVMRKALPPELIIVVERMADEIMAASCVMPVDR